MRDHERAHLLADELAHAVGDDLQRVDVEARVGLVEHGDARLQHRHLQDLDPLLLAAREAVVQVALRELARHLQLLHRGEHVLAELRDRDRVVLAAVARLADRVDRGAQEARDGHAGDRVRVLEREEEAALRALVRLELGHVLAVEEDLALGDLVGRVAHQRVRERRLAGAVRAHDRVDLVRVDREVDALDDLGAVLERDVQVLQFEQSHVKVMLASAFSPSGVGDGVVSRASSRAPDRRNGRARLGLQAGYRRRSPAVATASSARPCIPGAESATLRPCRRSASPGSS